MFRRSIRKCILWLFGHAPILISRLKDGLCCFPHTSHHFCDTVFDIDLFVNIQCCAFNFQEEPRYLAGLKKKVVKFIGSKKTTHCTIEEGSTGFTNLSFKRIPCLVYGLGCVGVLHKRNQFRQVLSDKCHFSTT